MEERRDVKGYEWLYQVSNLWRVKSLARFINSCYWSKQFIKEKVCKEQVMKNWYIKIWLSKDWKVKRYRVHRLIAETFIKNPDNKDQVNHKNWIKTDNRVENLEWCNISENMKHRYNVLWQKGHWCKYWTSPRSKEVIQYKLNWEFIKIRESASLVYDTLKINVMSCCKWRTKTAWWFIWAYSKK